MAYSIDYNTLSNQLNDLKRKLGFDAYNIHPVYTSFISAHGYQGPKVWNKLEELGIEGPITVEKCADVLGDGVYLLLSGDRPKGLSSNHIVCVIDTQVWDSWDSLNQYVKQVCVVSRDRNDFEISEEDILKIVNDIQEYSEKLFDAKQRSKFDDSVQFTVANVYKDSRYKYELNWKLLDPEGPSKPRPSDLRDRMYPLTYPARHYFYVNIEPKKSYEDNIKTIRERCAYELREWCWAVRKAIKDYNDKMNLQLNPRAGYINRDLILKLPADMRPTVTELYNNSWDGGADYQVTTEALPDDPRAEENPYVTFSGNMREIKWQWQQYKNEFKRFQYDF